MKIHICIQSFPQRKKVKKNRKHLSEKNDKGHNKNSKQKFRVKNRAKNRGH